MPIILYKWPFVFKVLITTACTLRHNILFCEAKKNVSEFEIHPFLFIALKLLKTPFYIARKYAMNSYSAHYYQKFQVPYVEK